MLVAGLLFAAVATQADAQTYPTTNTYVPNANLAPQTLSAAGTVPFSLNGIGVVTARLTGTYTGLTGAFQVTTERTASPTWTTISALPVGATTGTKPISAITTNGLYKLNVAGYAQLRFNATVLSTGSVVVAMNGTPTGFFHIPGNSDGGALITNTAQAAATVSSPDQSGAEVTSVVCVFNQTANTAGSTTFSIQNKDAASGLYYNLVSSAAVTTANNTPSAIAAGAGVQASANVSSSLPIGATWRVTEVAAGTSTTGTIGCSVH